MNVKEWTHGSCSWLDSEISDDDDDDVVEEGDDETCSRIGMTREEKAEACRQWLSSLIIKLVGRSIDYHYLWRRLQAMWRTQAEPLLIDLGNDFFIVKLLNIEEYEQALSNGHWLIGDNYLHVQRWRSNFSAKYATIKSMPIWVCFPNLPVEYYKEAWLKKTWDLIGRTIKVDDTTCATSRGKFARVWVKIDLRKPLRSKFILRERKWMVRYKGLQDICFVCGKYGHKEICCSTITTKKVQGGGL